VLTRIRKITSASSFLVAVMACLFFASKVKFSHSPVQPKKVNPQVEVATQVLVEPVRRSFSKQLNRGRSQIVKTVVKKTQRISKVKKQKLKKENQLKLAQMAEIGLAESPQGSAFNIDPYESEVRLDPLYALDSIYPRELLFPVREGVLVANRFDDFRHSLKELKAVPELAPLVEEEPSALVAVEEQAVSELKLDSQEDQVNESAVGAATQLQPLQAAPVEVNSLISKGKELLNRIQQSPTPTPTPTPPNAPSTQSPISRNHANKNVVPGVDTLPVTTQSVGTLYGKLTLDTQLREWVDSGRGHVELRLQKAGSSEPQDAFFIDYRYPERDFSWDGSSVEGNYQLIASFFKPEQPVAVAQVLYPQVLNEQTAKQMVVFHIKKDQLDGAIRSSRASFQGNVVLSGTVFEAASGDHQTAKTISHAEIEVVGMPEWGVIRADSLGSFRIPHVTAHSEYILSISASGYYPTQVVVPTFEATGYVSVFLVSKDKIDTITRFFTKRAQMAQKSIIMGRVFAPETRSPQKDQEVVLSGRKGKALYFGVFPDPSLYHTTETGLYAYLNVEPGYRSVGKANASAWELIGVKPDHAYYFETGRGGKHDLKGALKDPYLNQRVMGLVKVVGSPYQVETNDQGEFEIPGIELSPGVITLEVEARGYPVSWHNIAWSARESKKTHTFYLPEAELIEEARQLVAKTNSTPHTGTIFGGAEKSFFGSRRSCVYLTLETAEGRPVREEHGPFPLTRNEAENPNGTFCISKQKPGFSFYNLLPGQYLLKWKSQKGEILRTHVVRVGSDRTTILVN